MMQYINLAAYKFIRLQPEKLVLLQSQLKQKTLEYGIKGTILLSPEGINLFLAGAFNAMKSLQEFLNTLPEIANLQYKTSESSHIPFKRMIVRIKKEIITMKTDGIQPESYTAPYIEPAQLKDWFDSNKPMVLLDTRNDFEFNMGSFVNAIHLDIKSFSDFPEATSSLPTSAKNQTVVTFCTGGIRCEKAAAYLLKQGFTDVWQLRDGILGYFEQCGGEYFQGNCFVFDNRIALDSQLREAEM
ncbi:MAG TPA: rhodanese-like domain-containing protein [Gammaproteobacteria bacterium]|nr:rhodanese-like domain-containing protein [Gammaproteobacteria bacterium]